MVFKGVGRKKNGCLKRDVWERERLKGRGEEQQRADKGEVGRLADTSIWEHNIGESPAADTLFPFHSAPEEIQAGNHFHELK